MRPSQVDGFINVSSSNRKTLLQYGTDQKTLHFIHSFLFLLFVFVSFFFFKTLVTFPYSLLMRSRKINIDRISLCL